jgi:Uma2 family endonuclease
MSIAISAPKTLPPAQRLVLHNVTWDEYELFCRALNEQHVRSAYAEGSLELMSPLHVHELYKELLGRFLVFLAFELNIPIKSGGSTTFRRRDLEKGLEPDTWQESDRSHR